MTHLQLGPGQVAKVRRVVRLEAVMKTIVRPRLPAELVHESATKQVERSLSTRQDLALLEREALEVASQRGQNLDVPRTPAADPLRLPDVDLARSPVDVAPLVPKNFFGSKSSEAPKRETLQQPPFTVSGFEASPHLLGRQDCRVLMLASNLRNALHRVARDRFEKILAPTEEAPRDTVVIVPRRRRQVRQRSQPRVEFSMSDSVDRVASP